MLFLLLTGSVLFAALYRVAGQSLAIKGLLMVVELVLITFGAFGLLFLLAYPLGRLNKYFFDQMEEGQSPFASHRLPSQILPPTQPKNE